MWVLNPSGLQPFFLGGLAGGIFGSWLGRQLFGRRRRTPREPDPPKMEWTPPEVAMLESGQYAKELEAQRRANESNLLAAGVSQEEIQRRRAVADVQRELGIGRIIAEKRQEALQRWLNAVSPQRAIQSPEVLQEMAKYQLEKQKMQQQSAMLYGMYLQRLLQEVGRRDASRG